MKATLLVAAGRLFLSALLLVGNVTSGDAQLDFELDVQYVPQDAPFFKVQFSHTQHRHWNSCSDCHPGASSQRAGMLAIFAGESCGSCHGNTAFVVETDCWRCHDNLARPTKAAAETDVAMAREAPVP